MATIRRSQVIAAMCYMVGAVVALCLWGFALHRVLFDPIPKVPFLVNVTPSLPYTFALVDKEKRIYQRGDYVIYRFHGDAVRYFPYLNGQPFFKIIKGVAGDRITVDGRNIYVNGECMGRAKSFARKRKVILEPIADTVVPEGYYYLHGTSPDSFDSRYAMTGLVPQRDIIAAVTPLF